ncbi:HSPB1-associated protein 1 isoform X2 [Cervus canadensis]|uniref:HSPB1-associated protein 1 isoform X2 n=1 Tax=Cervus canadensis TaxID=1574408 RepID=UPI001C9E3FB3|nr:HSPB1-associated protein 1 isoform X2 [Cervus canadensis]
MYSKHVKPFTPEKAKEIIMCLQQPAVFYNMVFDWPAQHWTAKHLSEVLHGKQIRFRMGTKSTDTGKWAEGYEHYHQEQHYPWSCLHQKPLSHADGLSKWCLVTQ